MRRNELIVLASAIALVILGFSALNYYDVLDTSSKITTAQAIEILIFLFLALVTAIYAKRTSDIADATKEQAKATAALAKAALRPIMAIGWIGGGDPRTQRISATFENIGPGPALNLKCYLTHPKCNFTFKYEGYTVIRAGEKHPISLQTEDFDFKEWTGFAINCDYEDVSKNPFRSTLMSEAREERRLIVSEL